MNRVILFILYISLVIAVLLVLLNILVTYRALAFTDISTPISTTACPSPVPAQGVTAYINCDSSQFNQ